MGSFNVNIMVSINVSIMVSIMVSQILTKKQFQIRKWTSHISAFAGFLFQEFLRKQ